MNDRKSLKTIVLERKYSRRGNLSHAMYIKDHKGRYVSTHIPPKEIRRDKSKIKIYAMRFAISNNMSFLDDRVNAS